MTPDSTRYSLRLTPVPADRIHQAPFPRTDSSRSPQAASSPGVKEEPAPQRESPPVSADVAAMAFDQQGPVRPSSVYGLGDSNSRMEQLALGADQQGNATSEMASRSHPPHGNAPAARQEGPTPGAYLLSPSGAFLDLTLFSSSPLQPEHSAAATAAANNACPAAADEGRHWPPAPVPLIVPSDGRGLDSPSIGTCGRGCLLLLGPSSGSGAQTGVSSQSLLDFFSATQGTPPLHGHSVLASPHAGSAGGWAHNATWSSDRQAGCGRAAAERPAPSGNRLVPPHGPQRQSQAGAPKWSYRQRACKRTSMSPLGNLSRASLALAAAAQLVTGGTYSQGQLPWEWAEGAAGGPFPSSWVQHGTQGGQRDTATAQTQKRADRRGWSATEGPPGKQLPGAAGGAALTRSQSHHGLDGWRQMSDAHGPPLGQGLPGRVAPGTPRSEVAGGPDSRLWDASQPAGRGGGGVGRKRSRGVQRPGGGASWEDRPARHARHASFGGFSRPPAGDDWPAGPPGRSLHGAGAPPGPVSPPGGKEGARPPRRAMRRSLSIVIPSNPLGSPRSSAFWLRSYQRRGQGGGEALPGGGMGGESKPRFLRELGAQLQEERGISQCQGRASPSCAARRASMP